MRSTIWRERIPFRIAPKARAPLLECLPRPLRRVLDLGSGGWPLARSRQAGPAGSGGSGHRLLGDDDRSHARAVRRRLLGQRHRARHGRSAAGFPGHLRCDRLQPRHSPSDARAQARDLRRGVPVCSHRAACSAISNTWPRRRRRCTSSSSPSRPARRIRRTNCWTWTHSLPGSAPSASSTSIVIGNGASWRCSQAQNPASTRPPATDSVLTGMSVRRFRSLARSWEGLGRTDPLFGILSDPSKWGGKWDADEFFASGRAHVEKLLRSLHEIGAWFKNDTCLDFGCGVGRLTVPLSESFDRTIGVDVARSMIDQARRYHAASSRCEFLLNRDLDLRQFPDATFDFVHSCLVLQHIPPGYLHPVHRGILSRLQTRRAGRVSAARPKRVPRASFPPSTRCRTRPTSRQSS